MAKTKKVEDGEVEVKVNEPKKSSPIKITASFITKDLDGLKTKHDFIGVGDSIAKAIDDIKGDEGQPFPQGCNCLVNTVVEKDGSKIEKALAPHKARAIFQDKKVEVFEAVYRGL